MSALRKVPGLSLRRGRRDPTRASLFYLRSLVEVHAVVGGFLTSQSFWMCAFVPRMTKCIEKGRLVCLERALMVYDDSSVN